MMQFFKRKNQTELPSFWEDYKTMFEDKLPDNIEEVEFVVLDCETTGFDYEQDRILSIGALKVHHKSILVKESFEIYVKQEHFNKNSVEIHGILKKGPRGCIAEYEALQELLLYIKNDVVVGHHIMFDLNMINAALKRHGLPKLMNTTLDTELLYKRTLLSTPILQKKERYSLDDLADKYSISKKDRHTALGDAYITAIAFQIILDKLRPKSLKELLRKQNPPKFAI